MAVRTRRGPRGQAITEAALGMLLIATVIVFGIHFSEVAMLSLKVQEAGNSALWDTTGKRMHILTSAVPDFGPRGTAIGEAGPEATARYADFDGRSSHGGNTAPSLVFTRATPIQVTCSQDLTVAPMVMTGAPPLAAMFAEGVGGMVCWAESDFSLGPGYINTLLAGQTYHICSMGRANGGNCPARAAIALGDWGLSIGMEANNCELVTTSPGASSTCANQGYYQMTKATFDGLHNGGGGGPSQPAGDKLSQFVWGIPHGGPQIDLDENAFFLAAVGEDETPLGYQEVLTEHVGAGPYTVTPGGPYNAAGLQTYPQAAQQRDACAFGLPCDPTVWPMYQ